MVTPFRRRVRSDGTNRTTDPGVTWRAALRRLTSALLALAALLAIAAPTASASGANCAPVITRQLFTTQACVTVQSSRVNGYARLYLGAVALPAGTTVGQGHLPRVGDGDLLAADASALWRGFRCLWLSCARFNHGPGSMFPADWLSRGRGQSIRADLRSEHPLARARGWIGSGAIVGQLS
jgi:hypothetical protein